MHQPQPQDIPAPVHGVENHNGEAAGEEEKNENMPPGITFGQRAGDMSKSKE